MSELLVFCNPKQVYVGKSEREVAREYTKMAIEDYDELISFRKEYLPFVETPDYETVIGKKDERNILLTLFANQPIIRVGSVYGEFQSSSYLFNPESEDEELLLPDLDIIRIEGRFRVKDAANTIKQFYDKFGWETYIFEGEIPDKKEINPTSNRYNHPIQIINPDVLLEIAEEKIRYSLTDLCF